MKKLFLLSLLCLSPLTLFACNNAGDLEDNLSEITKVYYKGADENQSVQASISIGQREDPYKIDGYHENLCDFSLFAINFNQQLENQQITVSLTINNSLQEFTMYLNPVNHYYMADLGYLLGEKDQITITYQDYHINFYNVSKDFNIDWSQALNIAKENLKEELVDFYDGNNFLGECYLKILTEQKGNFEDLFWYFSVTGQNNEVLNIVISVESGEVLVE